MVAFTPYGDVGLRVEQWCVPPVVYLDHWAWRKISDSDIFANRFSNALKSRGGTLAFSWLNAIEFGKLTDVGQCSKADALLHQVLPHIFFLNPNSFSVIAEEDRLQAGGEPVAPHADLVTLKFFAKHNLLKSDSLHLMPPQSLFRLVQASESVAKFDILADLIINRLESLRIDYNGNREFQLTVNRIPRGQPIQRGTRFLARELIGSILKNQKMKISRNHAIDVSHAVVAVAYCDYVLLDGHWATQVEHARKRIADGDMSFPIAKVFSEKADGLERFLEEFESGAVQ